MKLLRFEFKVIIVALRAEPPQFRVFALLCFRPLSPGQCLTEDAAGVVAAEAATSKNTWWRSRRS